MKSPGSTAKLGCVEGATMIEPAKSIGSPGDVGKRYGGPSQPSRASVNGTTQRPFVPNTVPAPTKAELSGDHSAPCGKPLVASVKPLIWTRLLPPGSVSQRFLPMSTLAMLWSANTRVCPSADHSGHEAPDTVETIRCRPLPSAAATYNPAMLPLRLRLWKAMRPSTGLRTGASSLQSALMTALNAPLVFRSQMSHR